MRDASTGMEKPAGLITKRFSEIFVPCGVATHQVIDPTRGQLPRSPIGAPRFRGKPVVSTSKNRRFMKVHCTAARKLLERVSMSSLVDREYLDSLGKADLAMLSEQEWVIFVEAIVSGTCDHLRELAAKPLGGSLA